MPRKSIALDATSADTKTRILDAGERLFVEHGFEATSLRSLTTAAGVNLAAVHYHFGSKEELFQAVLTRRLDPMNQERIDLLARVERESVGRPLSCEKILFAMLIPALRLARDEKRGGLRKGPPRSFWPCRAWG
jgi:AcrR family transcriptional regulator